MLDAEPMGDLPHLLLVDDERSIREPLAAYLTKQGFRVTQCGDAESARTRLTAYAIDLVILDIMMPGEDGLSLCRHIAATSDVPVILLTARTEETDRIVGLEMGADDYVVKPFSPREVVARVMAILRRTAARAPNVEDGRDLSHGRLRLDLEGWRALWNETEIALTVTEFQMLRLLASVPGRVFSRDAIIDRLHGPGFAVTDRTIDSHIRNLRGKFAKAGANDLIETRAGIGYRLGSCAGSCITA